MLSAKLASAKYSLHFSVVQHALGGSDCSEQHLSSHKGIVPLPVTLPVVDG